MEVTDLSISLGGEIIALGMKKLSLMVAATTRLRCFLGESDIYNEEGPMDSHNPYLTTRCSYTSESLKYLFSTQRKEVKFNGTTIVSKENFYTFILHGMDDYGEFTNDNHCFTLLHFNDRWCMVDSYVCSKEPSCRVIADILHLSKQLDKLLYPADLSIYHRLFGITPSDQSTSSFYIIIEESIYRGEDVENRFHSLVERASLKEVNGNNYYPLGSSLEEAMKMMIEINKY